MRLMLSTINEADCDTYVKYEFDSMEALLSYVKQCGHAWTSLVVIVLPEENKNEA